MNPYVSTKFCEDLMIVTQKHVQGIYIYIYI